MSVTRCLKLQYLVHFSKPIKNRAVYRTIQQQRPRRILEFGVGSGERSLRMIELASQYATADQIQYVGADLFEDRAVAASLTLKAAYRALRTTGARIRLLPGDPVAVMSHFANGLGTFDLVVLSAAQDAWDSGRFWFYLPRILHPASCVLREDTRGGDERFSPVAPGEIESLASAATPRRAA